MSETNVSNYVNTHPLYHELVQDMHEHFTCMFCESSDELTIQEFPYCMTCVLEMTENPSKEDSLLSGCLP